MITKLKLLFAEARGKVTTYVALAIAGLVQLAEHAQELLDQWPTIAAYLPKAHVIDSVAHYVTSGLGLLVIYTRVRRALFPPKG